MAETVLDRVQKVMAAAGLESKQRDIAKQLDISQPSVNGWRSGKISLDNARAINDLTGACVEWIITGKGPMYPTASLPHELQEIIGAWDRLTPEARGEIVGHAKAVIAYTRSTTSTASPERLRAVERGIEDYQARNHKRAPEKPTGRRKGGNPPSRTKPRK